MTPNKLKHIAPILASLQDKESGFTTPRAYFETVENDTINHLESLNNLPKSTGFIHPKNYFDTLEEKIIDKLNSHFQNKQAVPANYFETVEDKVFEKLVNEKRNKKTAIRKLWIPAAIAASIVLIFSIYNPFTYKNDQDIAEVTQWIEAGNLDMSSYEIAAFFNDDLENFEIENSLNYDDLEKYIQNEFFDETYYN